MEIRRFRQMGWLATSVVLFAALAGLEWWTVILAGTSIRLQGVLTGIAITGGILVLLLVLNRYPRQWMSSVYSTLLAVAEMIVGAAVLAGLSGAAVLSLPFAVAAKLFRGDSATDFIVFAVIGLGLFVAARNWRHYAEQKSRAMEAELQAAKAQAAAAQQEKELALSQLMLMRAQVEPHFLWNTLAHVQFLIQKSPDDAGRMVAHLTRYLRTAVPQMRGDTTSLASEFASVEAYLELMKIRMGERLTVSVDLPEALRDMPFAPLLLQTLVENAIKHGIEPKVGPVSVSVQAWVDVGSEILMVEVRDDGVGLRAAPPTRGTGLGLRSVRERLKLLYGSSAALTVAGAPEGGVIARMAVPLQPVQRLEACSC
ncbi:sensor histidine kinase [Ralstonia insidiosa]|uniref:Histidine kinase n=1 Tax=Ralstonia insidiosa TaxID=190721 RepID=A0A848PEK8_9RALS|nr:histidine kinase [Ralstonia insidiosa]NMV41958.1 histidine kinase [Ralstonia insidiosa]